MPIRVLLVDDSPVVLAVLKKMLADSSEIEVAGVALNGKTALELIPQLNPDVVCTDLNMPVMDGLELTRTVMERFPRPILVISTAVQKEDSATVFKLLEAGAVDVFPKPKGGLDDRAVSHGVGERYSQFDDIGPILHQRVHQRDSDVFAGIAGRNEGNQRCTPLFLQGGKFCGYTTHISNPSRAATVCISLSPLPDKLMSSVLSLSMVGASFMA